MDKKRVVRKLNDYRNHLRNEQLKLREDPKMFSYYANKMEGLTVALNIVNNMEEHDGKNK